MLLKNLYLMLNPANSVSSVKIVREKAIALTSAINFSGKCS